MLSLSRVLKFPTMPPQTSDMKRKLQNKKIYAQNWNDDDDNREHVFDKENAYRAIAMVVCTYQVPPLHFSSEFIYFKNMYDIINPKFYVSFSDVERHCLTIYKEEKLRIKQVLENLDGKLSLSLEKLRYEKGRKVGDFLCLRAHFIDGDWRQKDWVIDFFRVCYTNETPETTLFRSLSDFNVLNKLSTITAANNLDHEEIIEMIENGQVVPPLGKKISPQSFRVHCVAYTFGQMVEIAFRNIDLVIRQVCRLVPGGRLRYPDWSVTLRTLKEAIELEAKGQCTEENGYDSMDLPSPKEWKEIRGACRLVGFVYNAGEVLLETKYPTASLYLHNILELRVNLTRESGSSDRFVKSTARKMLELLNEYLNDMFLVLAIATVLDPRCKMKFIEFSSMKYSKAEAQTIQAIRSLYNDYVACNVNEDDSDSDSEEEFLPMDVKERRKDRKFGFSCLDEFTRYAKSGVKSDLDLYLEEPVLPWTKNFKILNWWKEASPKYPILSKMVRDVLAIPLTLEKSDEAYLSIQRKPDEDLMSLRPRLMKALMCTRSWIEPSESE